MDINDDTSLKELSSIPAPYLEQLTALEIHTVSELLGATQGLQRFPSEDNEWEKIYDGIRELIGAERLTPYQEAMPLPATGLRGKL